MQLIRWASKGLIILSLLFSSSSGFTQTCNDRVQATTQDSRFQLDSSEVLDLKTELIWQRCSVGQSWDGTTCTGTATRHAWAQALALGDTQWRLPNSKELASIVELSCNSPAINLNIFPATVSSWYWSSSPFARLSDYAWGINFVGSGGLGVRWDLKGFGGHVRLVRGGQ